jgi:hypothetical protein
MRWKFSHLKKNRILGFAGTEPSKGVPFKASVDCGVEAMLLSVREVRTGVTCTCSLIFSWAACTDERVSGGQVDMSAISRSVSYPKLLNGVDQKLSVDMTLGSATEAIAGWHVKGCCGDKSGLSACSSSKLEW